MHTLERIFNKFHKAFERTHFFPKFFLQLIQYTALEMDSMYHVCFSYYLQKQDSAMLRCLDIFETFAQHMN